MMMNKRLIAMVGESKKYIAGNVIFQWLGMLANILMMYSITGFLGTLLPVIFAANYCNVYHKLPYGLLTLGYTFRARSLAVT